MPGTLGRCARDDPEQHLRQAVSHGPLADPPAARARHGLRRQRQRGRGPAAIRLLPALGLLAPLPRPARSSCASATSSVPSRRPSGSSSATGSAGSTRSHTGTPGRSARRGRKIPACRLRRPPPTASGSRSTTGTSSAPEATSSYISASSTVRTADGHGDRGAFGNWLNNLRNVRNICAHYGRVWNRAFDVLIDAPGQARKDADDLLASLAEEGTNNRL
ncbi:Abi family protein [Neomicrococcus lactis]